MKKDFQGCRILITGHCGLVGRSLWRRLTREGTVLVGLDLVAPDLRDRGNILHDADLVRAIDSVDGIIHLAAVSRVVWGQKDPMLCWRTNADATGRILELVLAARKRPWFLFASSREVYGEAKHLPVSEHTPAVPINIYGKSKLKAEQLTMAPRERGIRTAVVRLANVYGDIYDHYDRVIPAFARQAVCGEELRVDGPDHTFDFTHVDDTVKGLLLIAEQLQAGCSDLPILHLLPGKPVTLRELAELTVSLAKSPSMIRTAPRRDYDVCRFYGDPTLAYRTLGWRAEIDLKEGLVTLIGDFQREYAQCEKIRHAAGGRS